MVERVAAFPDLAFVVKVHQDFTHGPAIEPEPALADAFVSGIEPLAASGRLVALLAQFPVSFRPEPRAFERLGRIAERLRIAPLLFELRHRLWFEETNLRRVATLGAGLVHVDLPPHGDHPPAEHPSLGPLGYLRLHGRNAAAWFDPSAGRDARYDHRYDTSEVAEIAARARRIAATTERTLVVANNHYGGKAVAVALEVRAALEGRPVAAPAPLLDAFPDLAGRLVRRHVPGEQLDLFGG
jgi:uncharacterized protein YecE (DUF72 family)